MLPTCGIQGSFHVIIHVKPIVPVRDDGHANRVHKSRLAYIPELGNVTHNPGKCIHELLKGFVVQCDTYHQLNLWCVVFKGTKSGVLLEPLVAAQALHHGDWLACSVAAHDDALK